MNKRKPHAPGEILQEEYLAPLLITQKEFANHIGCDVKTINRLVNCHTRMTASMALRLSSALNTTPEFWLLAQNAIDIYNASESISKWPIPLIGNGFKTCKKMDHGSLEKQNGK